MASFGFAFPVQPGKEDLFEQSLDEIRARVDEYEESRRRARVTMERVWLQRNQDGSVLIPIYVEAESTFASVLDSFQTGSAFDRWFLDVNSEITGIDFNDQSATGVAPEHVGSWSDPAVANRLPGLAFTVPLLADKEDEAAAFAKEAYENRRDEFAESRRAQGVIREEVFLQRTPMGSLITVYGEGEDVRAANAGFAASQSPFDRWFKDSLREIFPPFVDFDAPVPDNRQAWDWQA
jgi:hypothetical protein